MYNLISSLHVKVCAGIVTSMSSPTGSGADTCIDLIRSEPLHVQSNQLSACQSLCRYCDIDVVANGIRGGHMY